MFCGFEFSDPLNFNAVWLCKSQPVSYPAVDSSCPSRSLMSKGVTRKTSLATVKFLLFHWMTEQHQSFLSHVLKYTSTQTPYHEKGNETFSCANVKYSKRIHSVKWKKQTGSHFWMFPRVTESIQWLGSFDNKHKMLAYVSLILLTSTEVYCEIG